MSCRLYSSQEIQFLISNYPTKGPYYCSNELNRSLSSIYSKVHKLGLKYHTQFIDLNKLDSPEGAYLLGFLWADGNVRKDMPVVRLSILQTDGIILSPIFQSLGEWKINMTESRKDRFTCHKPQMTFTVHDKWFYEYLLQLGYREKSLRSPDRVLNAIREKLHRFFWKGYFDGDGCFYVSEKQVSANISGPLQQSWKSVECLFNALDIRFNYEKLERKSGNSSRITIADRASLLRLGIYLYTDKKIGLPRKLEKFKQIVERYQKNLPVGYYTDRNKYRAEVWIDNVKHSIGGFLSKAEAFEARLKLISRHNTSEWIARQLISKAMYIISCNT